MIYVKKLLESIGKKIFVEYYGEFKETRIDKHDLAEKLLVEYNNALAIGEQFTS